jgi:hypothetical protein
MEEMQAKIEQNMKENKKICIENKILVFTLRVKKL